MSTNWAALARTYLAHRSPAVLEQAIAAAQEQEVIVLLRAFQEQDTEAVGHYVRVLHESLHRAGRTEEALTVALLHVDLRVRLVQIYNRFPVEQQLQALQMGLESCNVAIALATRLNDFPCVAVYWDVAGNGLDAAGHLDAARQAYEAALAIRQRLAAQQPQVYEPDVATTLNNLGIVLSKLREWAQAQQAYEAALTIYQRLAIQPCTQGVSGGSGEASADRHIPGGVRGNAERH